MNNTVQNETAEELHQEAVQTEGQVEKDRREGKRRKRRRKHRVKRHSPEHYQEIKQAKANRKRETEWDNRFALECGPLRKEGLLRASSSKKVAIRSLQRGRIPNDARVYQTFDGNKGQARKSFKIRVVSKKEDRSTLIEVKNEGAQQIKGKLLQELEDAHRQLEFNSHHHQIMVDIVNNSISKSLTSSVQAEIMSLRNAQSHCSRVQQAIEARSYQIKKLKETGQEDRQQTIKQYQLCTLKVLEEIQFWKENMEKMFRELTHIKAKLSFITEEGNYIAKMGQEMEFMLQQDWQDVFLLSLSPIGLSEEFIVKVRACETLILEEQLGTIE